ncbi:unnamed protein product [Rotaria sp. Silwood1]|nr:unnamed protein product [Rotaria sp. Silwood1]CAF1599721.1 unnamed protein product [Rotaria sp. Silwood1]
MTSRPRLYARSRACKTNSCLSSSSKPDVLVLLDDDADSNLIVEHLSKEPILCQVIVLPDVDALNQYYRSHDNNDNSNKWIYLVTSISFTDQINKLANVNDDFYSISTSEYILALEEVCRVFDKKFELFHDEERLAKALRDHLNSFLTLDDVELSSQSVSLQTPSFAWFQFMFMLLSRLERSDIGMQEVIDRLRIDYHFESDTIEEFIETYSSEKAIEWCMKDSFYFGHINHTLRSKDIKNIFTHRTIIRDVEQSLISWHYDQKQVWKCLLPMNVYRGQKTSKQELKSWQSNIGSIITMTSFLSTSMDKKIASVFAETFDNDDNDDEATLFTIWVDKNIAPKSIFAYLYHADCEPDDHEILFSLRTLFRIDKVEYDSYDETWYINMTVVDESNEEVQRVTAPWKTSILKENNSFQSENKSLIYVRDLSADNGAFLSFQLSLDIVLRLDRNDFARQEMLSMCRTKFSHDLLTLAKIDRFEMNYQSEQDAVKWYTADSFLYRLLNEVLRIETVDHIFKLRYFIQDLHNQLALMQVDYLKRLNRYNLSILKLYRGQVMTRNDLENNFRTNKGNLVSMNSFLSTTTDRYVARAFASDGDIENPETQVSVLYEIDIDTRLPHSVPFAELGDQSNFEHEDEVLFSMGAIFRIGETYEEHRYLWTVKLTLTTNEDEQWNVLTEHLQQQEEASNQMNRQISMINNRNEKIIINPNTMNTKKRRSRSFNDRYYLKREFRRSNWSKAFQIRMSRRFEHPEFQLTHKEI